MILTVELSIFLGKLQANEMAVSFSLAKHAQTIYKGKGTMPSKQNEKITISDYCYMRLNFVAIVCLML